MENLSPDGTAVNESVLGWQPQYYVDRGVQFSGYDPDHVQKVWWDDQGNPLTEPPDWWPGYRPTPAEYDPVAVLGPLPSEQEFDLANPEADAFVRAAVGDCVGDLLYSESGCPDAIVKTSLSRLLKSFTWDARYLFGKTADGRWLFVYEVGNSDWEPSPLERRMRPSIRLEGPDGEYLLIWLFADALEDTPELIAIRREIGGSMWRGYPVPLPWTDGYRMPFCDPSVRYSLNDFRCAMPSSAPTSAPRVSTAAASNELKPNSTFAEIMDALERLPSPTPPAALTPLLEAIANLTAPVEMDAALVALGKKSKSRLPALQGALKHIRKRNAKTDTGLVRDKDGVLGYHFEGEPDEYDAVRVCKLVVENQNGSGSSAKPIYTHGAGGMMRLERNSEGRHNFVRLDNQRFQAELNQRIAFRKIDDKGGLGSRKLVPPNVGSNVYHLGQTYLPETPEHLRVPVFLPSDQLLSVDGWHRGDGFNIFMDTGDLRVGSIPDRPSAEMAAEALALLDSLLVDFPFWDRVEPDPGHASDGQPEESKAPGRAMAMAMLITPFMRRMISGCTPMFYVTKPTAGTGGSLLGGIPGRLVDGGAPVAMAYSPNNDEENRKMLVSVVIDGPIVLYFDDVNTIESRVLIQALTSPTLSGRILGHSKTASAPNNRLWVGSANNPTFGPEMDRRVVKIRLNARTDDLKSRVFTQRQDHDENDIDFIPWIDLNRGALIRAILILIQRWIGCGKTPFVKRSLTSFESWARSVGGVLQAAGVEGFLQAARTTATDPQTAADRKLVQEWWSGKRANAEAESDLAEWLLNLDTVQPDGRDDEARQRWVRAKLMNFDGRVFSVIHDKKPLKVEVTRSEVEDKQDGIVVKFALKRIEPDMTPVEPEA